MRACLWCRHPDEGEDRNGWVRYDLGGLRKAGVSQMVLSLAWFPADEWALAIERWPDLLDELPVDHAEYSQRIEARLKSMAPRTAGKALTISPLTVNELDETEGERAGSSEGRAYLAAEIARTGRALHWPPSRNDACWCGSGRKYKRCCGPTPSAED